VSSCEPMPVTVTVPVGLDEPPVSPPILIVPLSTTPPAEMFKVPLPKRPTQRPFVLFHCEPLPVTVTVPAELVALPAS
jgi:hypothetical protein